MQCYASEKWHSVRPIALARVYLHSAMLRKPTTVDKQDTVCENLKSLWLELEIQLSTRGGLRLSFWWNCHCRDMLQRGKLGKLEVASRLRPGSVVYGAITSDDPINPRTLQHYAYEAISKIVNRGRT
jgi:hypothetical protein